MSSMTETGGANYERAIIKSGESYSIISRVSDTIIKIETTKAYKDSVDEIIDYLGY